MTGLSFADSTSALQANANATGAVSDAIANAQTHGYKESNGFFLTLVTGSGNSFAAGGVLSQIAQNVSAQGVLETSNSATHLAIAGNGFFVTSRDADIQEIEYTRAGHFYPDKQGNLQNIAGNYLQGWATDDKGVIPAGTSVSDVASLQTINVSKVSGLAKVTENISLQLNLPSSDAVGEDYLTVIPVFDSLGARHNINIQWTKTVANPATWTGTITCPDAPDANITRETAGTAYNGATPLTIVFDGNGKPVSFDGNPTAENLSIDWDDGITNAADSLISLDLGTIGESNGMTSQAGNFLSTMIEQDGREFGTFRSVSISEDGIVSAIYSNGEELKIARVALANFAAPDRLEAQTGNSWVQTGLSGTYVLDLPKSGGLGKIISNALEKSTVDVAEKMTSLIELQNHYVANTKTISTKKNMFDSLMSIKT